MNLNIVVSRFSERNVKPQMVLSLYYVVNGLDKRFIISWIASTYARVALTGCQRKLLKQFALFIFSLATRQSIYRLRMTNSDKALREF